VVQRLLDWAHVPKHSRQSGLAVCEHLLALIHKNLSFSTSHKIVGSWMKRIEVHAANEFDVLVIFDDCHSSASFCLRSLRDAISAALEEDQAFFTKTSVHTGHRRVLVHTKGTSFDLFPAVRVQSREGFEDYLIPLGDSWASSHFAEEVDKIHQRNQLDPDWRDLVRCLKVLRTQLRWSLSSYALEVFVDHLYKVHVIDHSMPLLLKLTSAVGKLRLFLIYRTTLIDSEDGLDVFRNVSARSVITLSCQFLVNLRPAVITVCISDSYFQLPYDRCSIHVVICTCSIRRSIDDRCSYLLRL